jgi:urate oxidase
VAKVHSSAYGESRLRMLRVLQRGDRHDPKDLTIGLRFEGSADTMVPGEAVKNLVHRVVREQDHAASAIESLALEICAQILARHPDIGLARVDISEQPWARLDAGGKAQGQTFTPAGGERRTTSVSSNGTRVAVSGGLENLVLLRTSGFAPTARGRPADEATADGLQRLFVATLAARWVYTSGDIAFVPYRAGVRQAIVETFAWHKGPTIRATLAAITEVVLASYQEIAQITLSLQEHPYRPVDLLELSVKGDALFVVREEPVGLIEITVDRDDRSS